MRSLKGPVAQDVADLKKYIDEFSKKKEGAETPSPHYLNFIQSLLFFGSKTLHPLPVLQ